MIAVLLDGCAAKELYVVMPEEKGNIGVVTVERGGQKIELRGAYNAAEITAFGNSETMNVDQALVRETFGAALAA